MSSAINALPHIVSPPHNDSISGVKDCRINAGKLCRNFEIKDRNLLCRSVVNVAVKDSIDDTTSILNGDSLACAVPACINKISLGTALFHSLNQLFTVLRRMELQECLSEAC